MKVYSMWSFRSCLFGSTLYVWDSATLSYHIALAHWFSFLNSVPLYDSKWTEWDLDKERLYPKRLLQQRQCSHLRNSSLKIKQRKVFLYIYWRRREKDQQGLCGGGRHKVRMSSSQVRCFNRKYFSMWLTSFQNELSKRNVLTLSALVLI